MRARSEWVVKHLELSGFVIDERDQVIRKGPGTKPQG
jgi:hypothetical protein